MKIEEIKRIIEEKIPEGSVIPRHDEKGHKYEIVPLNRKIFKSVTTRLQVLKDESLLNYKMNRALDYIFAHHKEFTDANVMEHIEKASNASGDILEDAGDLGRRVHDYRQDYFTAWMKSGVRPENVLSFVPAMEPDIRAVSAMRALQKFVTEKDYIPVACEKYVYSLPSHNGWNPEVAGTLDDIGVMRKMIREGDPTCAHEMIEDKKEIHRCIKCDRKYKYELVLMDLKTSNQFKDHYFFQVAMYYMMFVKLTGLRPKRCFILKVSKEDGNYKIEELFHIGKLVAYAKNMLKTNEALDFIRSIRKDNQKNVIVI